MNVDHSPALAKPLQPLLTIFDVNVKGFFEKEI